MAKCFEQGEDKMKIYSTDCLTGMKNLADNSVDFICTDLPYGVMDYDADKKINLAEMWQEFRRILKPCCVVALFASSRFTFELAASNMDWYKYKWVWVKNFATLFIHAKNRPLSKYEEILIFSNGKIQHAGKSNCRMKYNPQGLKSATIIKANGDGTICLRNCKHKGDDRKRFGGVYHKSPSNVKYREQEATNYPSDVLYFNAPHNMNRNHPNEKPVDLLEYLIKTYSNEGETVLDCTMGSGSCGVACVNTNREFIGYELNKKYYDVASERIIKAMENKYREEKAKALFETGNAFLID